MNQRRFKMRTSETINNQEVQAYQSWCSKHHVFLEGAEGTDNGNFVRDYFLKTWGEDITEANLDKALPYIRPHLKFKSDAYLKLEQAANGMTPQEAEIFDAWLSRQRLESPASDQGKENATNLLTWLRERNLEIIGRNLDVALQNIINNGHLGHAPLVWKPIKVKKQDREMSDAEIATWRSRAESARVETPSGLVLQGKTAEVQKIVVTADGKTDWKATALAREIAAARMMGK
jgi:hypothetical protein